MMLDDGRQQCGEVDKLPLCQAMLPTADYKGLTAKTNFQFFRLLDNKFFWKLKNDFLVFVFDILHYYYQL